MCNHPDVAHLLQPLPQPASSRPDPNTQVHPYGGGKGKQKGGKRTGLTSLPAALRDHGTAVTSQGHALCFGHSLKNSKAVVQKGFICAASKDVSELIPIRTALSLRMPSLQSDHRLRRL